MNSPSYRPLVPQPLQEIGHDPDLATSGLPQLAAALGVIGRLAEKGAWGLAIDDPADPNSGVVRISGGAVADVYFVATEVAAISLLTSVLDPGSGRNVVVIHSHDVTERGARSPATRFGRTGLGRLTEVGMATLLAEGGDADRLAHRLREEVGI